MTSEPLVSIAIPVKNGEKYIYDCLRSVLCSLGEIRNYEVIISDNLSTDQTIKEIQKIYDPRVRVIKPKHGLSIGENWTFASRHAKGKYFKLVGADDLLIKNSIQKEIDQLESHPTSVALISCRKIIGSRGEVLLSSRGYGKSSFLEKGDTAIKKMWNSGTNLFGDPSAILFRNYIVQENLPWESKGYPYVVDLSLYLKTFAGNDFLVSAAVVSEFRIHPNSVTGSTYLGHARQFLRLYKEKEAVGFIQNLRVGLACYWLQTLKLFFILSAVPIGWLTRSFIKS